MSISESFLGDLAGSTATNGWLNLSGNVTGYVDSFVDSDWFKTYLVAGVRYTVQMQGFLVDSYLALRDASGNRLVLANASGAGVTETLTFTPTVSGIYFVDAQSGIASSSGSYTVSLRSTLADDYAGTTLTTSTLALGVTRSAALEQPADADWHRVELVAGRSYLLDAGGALANPFLQMFDRFGYEVGASGSRSMSFRPTTSGTYYVEVSGNNLTSVGAYTLRVAEVPTVSVDDLSFFEGHGTRTTVNFVLRLSGASTSDVTVKVQTQDLTAVAGLDYVALSQTVTIPAGRTSVQVPVQLVGDRDWEPNKVFELVLSNATLAIANDSAYGTILDDDSPAGLNLPTDALFGFQWNLYTVRAAQAWQLATGRGVKVGVFDQGIDATNPDLKANTSAELGRVSATLARGGSPQSANDQHGTFVAGVIGAARDDKGIVGMAYDATLVPIYSPLQYGPAYLAEIANAFRYAVQLDVLNNSWGFGNKLLTGTNWAFLDDAAKPDYAPAFAALKNLAVAGRGGLGTVVVQAAGNGYDYGDDTNLHNFQNSRYVITVGATDYFGRASTFSTTGASVLVSAPGGAGDGSYDDILSTDRTGAAGRSTGDHAFVNGTSFAAPLVSGVVALMLEVNPALGYRDVQQILAYTARRTEIDVGTWDTNGAANWNGGGLHYNAIEHATGFGQVDALAAVRLAESWNLPALTAANLRESSIRKVVNQAIPDNLIIGGGATSTITVTEAMTVERVDVTVNIRHPYIGDLSVLLTSPSGTTSFLLWRPAKGALSAYGSSQDDVRFTFDTVLNWGESAVGNWVITAFDNAAGLTGTFENWTLTLVGQPDTADDVYVYTGEYPGIVAADPSRGILRDLDGGTNTLNTAALGQDNRIDLKSGRAILDGTPLTIAAGTRIATAIGGDGHDALTASDLGTWLRGMRGDDVLVGGAGNDRLEGGLGRDNLDGGAGIDVAIYEAARASATITRSTGLSPTWGVRLSTQDQDTLQSVERIRFSDLSLALDLGGNAGNTAKVIGALFGPARVADEAFVGRWLARADGGLDMQGLIASALASPEYLAAAGARTHTAFVNLVYRNVVGISPDAAARELFVGMLDRGEHTQVTLAELAANLDLTAARIDLTGLALSGLEYLPG